MFGPRQPATHFTQNRYPGYPRDRKVKRRIGHATDYEKTVNPKLPGSWDKKYAPPRKEIINRVVDRHANIGMQVGGVPATAAGMVGGALLGTKLGGNIGGYAGAAIGGALGLAAGGIPGYKLGKRRGKRIAKEIPKQPGNVRDFKSKHPILSRVYFPRKKNVKKYKKVPYNRDYRVKDITMYNSDAFGPMVLNTSASRPERKKASIRTGFAKQGYYREGYEVVDSTDRQELIEHIMELLFEDRHVAEGFGDAVGKTVNAIASKTRIPLDRKFSKVDASRKAAGKGLFSSSTSRRIK